LTSLIQGQIECTTLFFAYFQVIENKDSSQRSEMRREDGLK